MNDRNQRAARYSDLFEGAHGRTCSYCPLCVALEVARAARPEVLGHLAVATREVLAALAILVEEAEAAVGRAGGGQPPEEEDITRIDVV